jgi:DNA mismatch repair protein MutS
VENTYPPLIQSFIDLQLRYPDFIILTEVGGFYEIWQLDALKLGHAERASQILDIVLTRRDKSKVDSPKMAGFPSHSVNHYLRKLVAAGETVVVVKQEVTGKKSDNNKNVKRHVERIVSPATTIDESADRRPNYFAAVYQEEGIAGVCLIDLSTGYVSVAEMTGENLKNYIETIVPAEILFINNPYSEKLPHQIVHTTEKPITRQATAGLILAKTYDIENPSNNHAVTLTQLGLERWPLASLAVANLLNFLTGYNPLLLKKIALPRVVEFDRTLFLSKNAHLSLDIFESPLQADTGKTLFGVLNKCKTAMGGRTLRRWLEQPLSDLKLIEARQEAVAGMIANRSFFDRLAEVYDLSRMMRRLALNSSEPHELPSFYKSLKVSQDCLPTWQLSPEISGAISYLEDHFDFGLLENSGKDFHKAFSGPLREAISNDAKLLSAAQVNLTKETQRLSALIETNKLRVVDRQESKMLSGPKSLAPKCEAAGVKYKIKASEIEVKDQAWEAAAYEELSLKNALDQNARRLWVAIQSHFVNQFGTEILAFSEAIGELDALSTFAKISHERNYVRPSFVSGAKTTIKIERMRHPILELSKTSFESFVPNDLDLGEKSVLVIYGANSAGKSTVLKGLALNIIMAQAGCFVAAKSAEFSVFDSVMTRMTTYDSLSEGLSTFTMEMIELQNALKRANERSLFLFDEIGRGTSVADGEALAFGIIEHLNSNPVESVTLFATHYHSLFESIKEFSKVSVKHFDCEVFGGDLIFSRELKDGPGTGSYGLAVAQKCGVPESIIRVSQNYKKHFAKVITSRYNSKVIGTLCEWCKQNEAQETHHVQDQLQGKVTTVEISGIVKGIHDEQNLILLCGSCHNKVTTEKISLRKRRSVGLNSSLVDSDTDVRARSQRKNPK